jgi:hypothetical protein
VVCVEPRTVKLNLKRRSLTLILKDLEFQRDKIPGTVDLLTEQVKERIQGGPSSLPPWAATPGKLTFSDIPAHCECALLAYFSRPPDLHPYNYIGASKLSCHGCQTFFEAYNSSIVDKKLPGSYELKSRRSTPATVITRCTSRGSHRTLTCTAQSWVSWMS